MALGASLRESSEHSPRTIGVGVWVEIVRGLSPDSHPGHSVVRGNRMLKVLPLLLLLSACTLGPGNFQSSHSTDLGTRNIKRIAIFPLDPIPSGERTRLPSPSVLSNFFYSTMAALPHWQIVSDREVGEVKPLVPQGSEGLQARKLGDIVYADAVIFGRIIRYRERVGEDWGAKSPASVAFVLQLWDVKRGDIIWTGRFDETQRALSENLFAFGEFAQRGARWLTAEELAQEGIKKAVQQLHQALYREPT